MPNQVTVTGVTQAGQAVTAKVIPSETVAFHSTPKMMKIVRSDGGNIEEIDISAATTITVTVSGGTYAFTVS